MLRCCDCTTSSRIEFRGNCAEQPAASWTPAKPWKRFYARFQRSEVLSLLMLRDHEVLLEAMQATKPTHCPSAEPATDEYFACVRRFSHSSSASRLRSWGNRKALGHQRTPPAWPNPKPASDAFKDAETSSHSVRRRTRRSAAPPLCRSRPRSAALCIPHHRRHLPLRAALRALCAQFSAGSCCSVLRVVRMQRP